MVAVGHSLGASLLSLVADYAGLRRSGQLTVLGSAGPVLLPEFAADLKWQP